MHVFALCRFVLVSAVSALGDLLQTCQRVCPEAAPPSPLSFLLALVPVFLWRALFLLATFLGVDLAVLA